MDQAQRAQRLDQRQLAPVETAELLVALDERAELAGALAPASMKGVSSAG